jgi:hypothetical protein
MSSKQEHPIQAMGFWLFGFLSVVLAVLKLTVVGYWSWWRVMLPFLAFLGHNTVYLLIVILGKVSVREISTVVVARACLWKCEKFEFADRLHWRRQASRGHEYVHLTLDVY